jgi:hypothetical protein
MIPDPLENQMPEFELATGDRAATILVLPQEPNCVRLAAEDLAADVEKITGRRPCLVSRIEDCAGQTVILASVSVKESARLLQFLAPGWAVELEGLWEAFRVESLAMPPGNASPITSALLVAGSDERGTMSGLYAFVDKVLGVDPLYYWTDCEPEKRSRLAWKSVRLAGAEPTFRFRGWFLNDEDLLTGWKDGGGTRVLDYPFYHQVIHPDVAEKVFEAMVRLGFNLVIPSSFIEIRNPAERRLIELATRRGLFVSMHHVEPLGVSAFGFANYWRERGRDVPFAYHTHRREFEEVWRAFAAEWAKFAPQLIWQLGLRGIADRPFWLAAEGAPATEGDRGGMITEAMQLQWEIIRSVDPRPHPLATTTLWAEGSEFMRKGLLKIPDGVTIVFADNNSGWRWQPDFYEVPREERRGYGVYFHHAIWGTGPHFAQAVSPARTHAMFREAVDHRSGDYAILNVANVREFPLGIAASAEILRDFPTHRPDLFLSEWCDRRFGRAGAEAQAAYDAFFDSYVVGDDGLPMFLDGLVLSASRPALDRILNPPTPKAVEFSGEDGESDFVRKYLPSMIASSGLSFAARLDKVRAQSAALDHAGQLADAAHALIPEGDGRTFFETNLLAQQRMMLGLTRWLEALLEAAVAADCGDQTKAPTLLQTARAQMAAVFAAQTLASQGKWHDWYRGDRKMNLQGHKQATEAALVRTNANVPPSTERGSAGATDATRR